MKRLFLMLSLLLTVNSIRAQHGSWKVIMNNKLLLATNKEDEKANCKTLNSAEWKKNGWLEISYKEDNPGIFNHSFQFTDESDNPVLTLDSVTSFKKSILSLRNLFYSKKEIRIYMIMSPRNSMMEVRTSMVHLFTLRLP